MNNDLDYGDEPFGAAVMSDPNHGKEFLYYIFPFLLYFEEKRRSKEEKRRSEMEASLRLFGDALQLSQWNRDMECVLIGVHTGKMICAEKCGSAPLAATRKAYKGDWERFTLQKNDDGTFSLKSAANGKYVSAIPQPYGNGHLIAQGDKVDTWEKFDIREVGGKQGAFTLLSRSTNKFVSVDENSGNRLIANRDVADEWEEFYICVRTR